MSYSDELKHPKWQRRRLERLSAAEWRCSRCAADEKPLHVHHKVYRDGARPWEYDDHELAVLCEDCHDYEHVPVYSRAEFDSVKAVADAARSDATTLGELLDKLDGIVNDLDDRAVLWELVQENDRLRHETLSPKERATLAAKKAAMLEHIRKVSRTQN